ncbi:Calx-beta domain-containing protein, partial [Xenococcus sp. PCC 7305]|uniref:Calx-beta domain-containing protein n=1 Tax=Xenococcus sp. PCC 7305 TaxID=102125 RepID=UPI0002AC52E8
MANENYVEVSPAVYTVLESDLLFPNLVTITLNRTGNINSAADIEVLLNGGSAQQGVDYDIPPGVSQFVTFEPGQTTATFEFEIFDDVDLEGTETIDLLLQAFPGNLETVIGNQGTAIVEILDNEVSNIEFSQPVYSVIESELISPNLASVTLTRTGNIYNPAGVDVLIAGGT